VHAVLVVANQAEEANDEQEQEVPIEEPLGGPGNKEKDIDESEGTEEDAQLCPGESGWRCRGGRAFCAEQGYEQASKSPEAGDREHD
jgi:hypothetical protein